MSIEPARVVKVKVGRHSYKVALDPQTGAVIYVKGTNAVRGEIALHVDGAAARAAIQAARSVAAR